MSRRAELEDLLGRIEARVAELEAVAPERRSRRDTCELELRAAVLRLANRKPARTDGAMTAVALSGESGVPRPTMYRSYKDVLTDWDAICAVADPESDAGLRARAGKLGAEVRRLERELVEERRRFKHVKGVLAQRVQALTLALVEARGDAKVTDLASLRDLRAERRRAADAEA